MPTGIVFFLLGIPILAMAIAEKSPSRLIFASIWLGAGFIRMLPRLEGAWYPWLALVWVATAILAGLGSIFSELRILPWLVGPAVVLALIVVRSIPKWARWMLTSIVLSSFLLRASAAEFGPNPLSNWLVEWGFSPDMAWTLTVAFRKAVHFGYFGLIGWAAFRGCRIAFSAASIGWPIGWVALQASLDETRQQYAIGRTGSGWDVAIDVAGAACLIGISIWRQNLSTKDLEADEQGKA